MAQNKPETAFTIENMLGTTDPTPLPKKPAPKKTGGLKKTLKWAGIGVLGVAAGFGIKAGVEKLMEPDAPAITQTAQAKTPVFAPLTLQQQVSNIVTKMKAFNAAHPDKAYSPQQIEQAQRDFVNNIERSEMLKRADKSLSDALDSYILKTLKTHLENNTVADAIQKTGMQTVEMVNNGRQNPRTHPNHLLIPGLEQYVNMKNMKTDHTGANISDVQMLSSAVHARIKAASAFMSGHTNIQAIELLKTFRGVILSPDLKFAVEKSEYEHEAASDRANRNVSKEMHENIEQGQDPFKALCNATQKVTGLDRNSMATPPAYIAKAYGAANQELTGTSNWVASIRATEKPTPSLPSSWWYIGAGIVAGLGAVSGAIIYKTRNKGEGLAKDIENDRKKDKKAACADEIKNALILNVPKDFHR